MKSKFIDALSQMFEKQIDILVGKKPHFDFEVAVKAIRNECRFFGAPRNNTLIVVKEHKWPYFEAYRNSSLKPFEQEAIIKELRIIKIEWSTVDTITTLRFSFNNGVTTP